MTMIRISFEEVAAIELYAAMCETVKITPRPWGDVNEDRKEILRRYIRIVQAVYAGDAEREQPRVERYPTLRNTKRALE